MDFYSLILTFAIAGGQLIKLPIGNGGVTPLDIAVIGFCTLGLLRVKFKLKRPPFFIQVSFVFIFIALLSLIFTPLKLTSFELFVSFSYIIRFGLYILLGWLVYCEAFPSLNKKITPLLAVSGTALATAGLLQLIFIPDLIFLEKFGWDPHYFRTASTFFDPNFLGAYMVLTLLIVYKKISRSSIFYNLAAVLIFIALLTTFSRGAYLAFLAAFLTLALIKKSIKFGLVTIFLFSILIFGFQIYQQIIAQPKNIDRGESAEVRLTTWQQGLQIFSTNPILGVGFNSYRYALDQNNFGNSQFLQSHGASTNDSSLLYVAATTGILGLISYLYFLLSLVLTNKRNFLLIAALAGLLAQSFFANTLFYPPLLLWIILMAVI